MKNNLLNIVIPMAGAGSRFSKVGYKDPKPLIHIHQKRMIEVVIKNLTPSIPHRFIFICQRTHLEQYDLTNSLKLWAKNSLIIPINGITEGAACTVLTAKEFINTPQPLMIANSDQFINYSISDYLCAIDPSWDGCIMTMKANDQKWSYIGYNQENKITKVVEKEVISDQATVGIYNFKHGADFVWAAEEMIQRNLRVNNEFYVAPAYNLLIEKNYQIKPINIGSIEDAMYGLGTPEDLGIFLNSPLSQQFK